MRTKKKKAVTKKRNPQDAPNRNVRAANKKIAEIEKRLLCLEIMYGALCSKSFRSRKK